MPSPGRAATAAPVPAVLPPPPWPQARGRLHLHPKHRKQPQRGMSPHHPRCSAQTYGSTTGSCGDTRSRSMGPPVPALQQSRAPRAGKASPELLCRASVGEGDPSGAAASPPPRCGHPSGPFIVSLSRIMKDPITLPGPRSCRSASFRLMPLKNHLQQKQRNQQTLPGLGELRLVWGRAGGRSGGSCGGGAGDHAGPGCATKGWTHSSVSSESAGAT